MATGPDIPSMSVLNFYGSEGVPSPDIDCTTFSPIFLPYLAAGPARTAEGDNCSISDMSCVDDSARNPTGTCHANFAACNEDADCKDCAALLSHPPDVCKGANTGTSPTCEEGGNLWCCSFQDHAACLENSAMVILLGALTMR